MIEKESRVLRIPWAPLVDAATTYRRRACPRCSSHSFIMHQKTWKSIKDLRLTRVQSVRMMCKRCGLVTREYPPGIDGGRQSTRLQRLTVLLYCLGLSYYQVRAVLADVRCILSTTTIRRNVLASRLAEWRRPEEAGICSHEGPQVRLTLPVSAISLRLVDQSPRNSWLELSFDPSTGFELARRARQSAEILGLLPPESGQPL